MIFQLVKRDMAWKIALIYAGAVALAALFYHAHSGAGLLGGISGSFGALYLMVQPNRRASLYEAALPIPGRDLHLARVVSLLALVWVPAVACALALLTQPKGAEAAGYIIGGAVALSLGMVLNLSLRLREFASPWWASVFSPAIAIGAAVAIFKLHHPIALAILCAALTAALGAAIWQRVPEALESAPVTISKRHERTGSAGPATPWLPLLRGLWSWQIVMMTVMAGFFTAEGQWFIGPMYVISACSLCKMNLRWAQGLPVSRRALLALSLAPSLLGPVCGAEIGMLLRLPTSSSRLVRLERREPFIPAGTHEVAVDRAFWAHAPNGVVPVVTAPWGETFQPQASRLAGVAFYNPYSVGRANTRRFEQWQLARATTRIFGHPLTEREVSQLKRRSGNSALLAPRMQVLTLATLILLTSFWSWLLELCSHYRVALMRVAVRNALIGVAIAVPIVVLIFLDMWFGNSPGSTAQALLQGSMMAALRHLPDSTPLVALATLPVVALAWALVDWQNARAEITAKPGQPRTLFEATRG